MHNTKTPLQGNALGLPVLGETKTGIEHSGFNYNAEVSTLKLLSFYKQSGV